MDFKSLMSKQISKAKPSTNGSSKYQRRGELEQEREAAYAAEQARLEKERLEKQSQKRKFEQAEAEKEALREEKKRKLAAESKIRREAEEIEEERARRKRLGLPDLPSEQDEDIPDEDLRTKLLELKQPESLDDETHEQRLVRYKKLKSKKEKREWYPGPIPTTLEPLPADEILLPENPPKPDSEGHLKLHRQISSYLNFVLGEWSKALAGRAQDDTETHAGIAATNNYKTALQDLKPLMRKIEAAVQPNEKVQPLPHDALLVPLVNILQLTQKRHYRDAVDAYLRLSIGKAAWPIGVTMVGIHERSAREKLHEDGKDREVAHIMSDETTRKWLQSLKRCISFAQSRWEVFDVGQLMG